MFKFARIPLWKNLPSTLRNPAKFPSISSKISSPIFSSTRFQSDSSQQVETNKIVVKNLDWNATREDVNDLLSEIEGVVDIILPKNRDDPNQNRGIAFVEFSQENLAQSALRSLDGTDWFGRSLRVEFAQPPGTRQPSRFQRGGRTQAQTIQIIGLPPSIQEAVVRKWFESIGTVNELESFNYRDGSSNRVQILIDMVPFDSDRPAFAPDGDQPRGRGATVAAAAAAATTRRGDDSVLSDLLDEFSSDSDDSDDDSDDSDDSAEDSSASESDSDEESESDESEESDDSEDSDDSDDSDNSDDSDDSDNSDSSDSDDSGDSDDSDESDSSDDSDSD